VTGATDYWSQNGAAAAAAAAMQRRYPYQPQIHQTCNTTATGMCGS